MTTTTHSNKDQIITYYDSTQNDYKMLWHLDSHMAMHFGFWDKGIRSLRDALWRENEVLATMAGVTPDTKVLDAGCGVGGSAIYLAKRYGCRAVGISLSSKQIKICKANARRSGVTDKTDFFTQDYTKTHFSSGTFDIVWAIESVCHAPKKQDFMTEAYRLLAPGGRLIIADYFLTKPNRSSAEENILNKWVTGWKMNPLVVRDDFETFLRQTGFKKVRYEDASKRVLPSLKRLFILSFPGYAVTWTMQLLGLRSATQTGNVIAARNQYKAMKRGLWQYGVFVALK